MFKLVIERKLDKINKISLDYLMGIFTHFICTPNLMFK